MKFAVAVRRANEDEAASRDHGAAVILASRVANSLGHKLGILTERNFPGNLTGIEVNRVERAPGRFHGRVAVRIKKFVIAIRGVFQSERPRGLESGRGNRSVLARHQVVHQPAHFLSRELRESRHSPATFANHCSDLAIGVLVSNFDQRRELGRGAVQILAVTVSATVVPAGTDWLCGCPVIRGAWHFPAAPAA